MPALETIDHGRTFDWGRTSLDYAKYRDIYPPEFYEKILSLGLCQKGQKVLDVGTGTGVLPRNLYDSGAVFTGTDVSENQIIQAKKLAEQKNMKIDFRVSATEDLDFPPNSFDVITACQCYFYFDHNRVVPVFKKILKPGGKLAILTMMELPLEDPIADASEKLILKYNPDWSGAGEKRHPILLLPIYTETFEEETNLVFDLKVHYTRESWNGRMKACRGVGASLPKEQIALFEREHQAMLQSIAPEEFDVLHCAAIRTFRCVK